MHRKHLRKAEKDSIIQEDSRRDGIMRKVHEVRAIQTDETYVYLTVDGQSYRVRWTDCSPRLAKATAEQRRDIDVSPSGYGLHWPSVDEDMAITPLLQHAELVQGRVSHVGPTGNPTAMPERSQ